ncbi:Uncharacterised protein [Salmonella enterica subsp. enterica serovar Bovismorbificans]|uniref:Uncharacterized protein n=1 Tax=Salmonella enterica subsp. enterica serovar Bovismorbificans TaxID=58097 RepID=A0A655CME6_SALET|nr:Uncharacterised protein [Salmonella enterica subsp. enterica serovar Bovismorbificans]CNU47518.1 Uncharacterised protein [Salmonella enterica subsp. enterica serovar Bovismorbificans]CNU71534.1 Uncharacterised protein [Salmonella enterica subsp. enterica serovar Bovismorbificans]CPR47370.1 Uncharacterised protein [Salmonella enterica subsp. enterica serovar Bovismorbificans]
MPASSRPVSASDKGRVQGRFHASSHTTFHIDHAVSHQRRDVSQLSDYWHPVSHAAAVRSAAVASERSVDRYRGRQPVYRHLAYPGRRGSKSRHVRRTSDGYHRSVLLRRIRSADAGQSNRSPGSAARMGHTDCWSCAAGHR